MYVGMSYIYNGIPTIDGCILSFLVGGDLGFPNRERKQ